MSHADTVDKKRLRWKSRRALLELDLLLARFWRDHEKQLARDDINLLGEWLALDDVALWQLLQTPPPNGITLAAKINSTQITKKGN